MTARISNKIMKHAFGPFRLVFAVLLMAAAIAGAQEQPPAAKALLDTVPVSEAEQAIRQTAKDFADAFNRGDAAAVAACWTEDGDYIDEEGTRYQGKAEIEKAYAAFLGGHPGVQMRIDTANFQKTAPSPRRDSGPAPQ